MSFRKKQLLGLGLSVFFVFIILIVILMTVTSMKTNMLEIVEDRYYKVNKATEIRQLLFQTDRALLDLVSNSEGEMNQETVSRLRENQAQIQAHITEMAKALNQESSYRILSEIETSYQYYLNMENTLISL
ncbi:MAG TPA: MCP four helix bundle domain-containing protein, partial [Chondromyces sp.]|nr:MCP four helix bundle domain-containing protein [Chondromyces sp.]